ncbi:MAG: PEP-CTERM sorting domain-containing protein [Cyanobacteria bacterium P01_C01_bin.118]
MVFRLFHSYFKFATIAVAMSVTAVFPSSVSAATFTVTDGLFSFTADDILPAFPGIDIVAISGDTTPAPGFNSGLDFLDSTDLVFSDDGGFAPESGRIDLAGVLGNTLSPLVTFQGINLTPAGNDFLLSDSIDALFDADVTNIISVGETLILEGDLSSGPGSILDTALDLTGDVGTFRIDAIATDITPAPAPPVITPPVDTPGDDPTSVPEPGTVFALLATAGAFWTRKRKQWV